MGEHTGFLFHKFRGELLGIFVNSVKSQAVLFHNGAVVRAGIDQITDQSPGQGAVGAGQGLGKNVRIAGHWIEPGIDHHQVGAVSLGIGKLGHERRMADRRVGAEEQDQISFAVIGKRVPETGDKMMPQKASIVAGRVIGKIVGGSKRMGKPADVFLLLQKTDGFTFPHTHAAGARLILDVQHFLGNFVQGLPAADLDKCMVGQPF